LATNIEKEIEDILYSLWSTAILICSLLATLVNFILFISLLPQDKFYYAGMTGSVVFLLAGTFLFYVTWTKKRLQTVLISAAIVILIVLEILWLR